MSGTPQPSQPWPPQPGRSWEDSHTYPAPSRPPNRRPAWPWVVLGVAVAAGLAWFGFLVSIVIHMGPPAPLGSQQPYVVPSEVPTPDASQRVEYLGALRAINPGLVADENTAVLRGRAICDHILRPSGRRLTLTEYTVAELSGGNVMLNAAQAQQVITAVQVWCH